MRCKYAGILPLLSLSKTEKRKFVHSIFFSRDLRQLRIELLQLLCNPTLEQPAVRDAFDRYISLLSGFITPPEGPTDDSKLRYTTRFYWTDSLTKTDVITFVELFSSEKIFKYFSFRDVQDIQFEICCMTMNVAMWYTKHAAYVASKSST